MSVSPAAYRRQIDRLIGQVGKLDARARADAVKLLRDLNVRLNREIAATDFARFQRGNVQRALGDLVREFGRTYEGRLNGLDAEIERLVRDFHGEKQDAAGRSLGAPVTTIPQLEVLRGFRADLIRGMEAETIGRISNEINLGVLAGKSPFEIQQAIRPFVTPIRRKDGSTIGILARSEMISRTEINRVFALTNQAQQANEAAALEAIGEKPMKIWVTAGDDRVRESHVQAGIDYGIDGDPGPIPIDEPFIVGGEELRFPLDPAASPAATVGCRCVTTLVSPSIVALTAKISRAA